MNLFETVKNSVTAREAAELYGLQVHRNGFCTCPFHDDHHPSMKVDRRYHCFGCQADGDVIDFVGRLFNLSPKDAALKLASDFHIRIDGLLPLAVEPKRQTISEQEIGMQSVESIIPLRKMGYSRIGVERRSSAIHHMDAPCRCGLGRQQCLLDQGH